MTESFKGFVESVGNEQMHLVEVRKKIFKAELKLQKYAKELGLPELKKKRTYHQNKMSLLNQKMYEYCKQHKLV